MLDFCPQDLGAKETGRLAQCKASGLSFKEAARYFTEATPKNFQSRYNNFVLSHPREATVISNLRPTGVGPGEMVAWFLFDNVLVGGANASCDLSIEGKDFAELKAGAYCKKHHCLQDFKLSKDQDPSVKYIVDALTSSKPAVTVDFSGTAWSYTGQQIGHFNSPDFQAQVSQILASNAEKPVDKECIVANWKDLIFAEYVQGKTMAMIQTKTLEMRYFGELTKDMVGLYRIHRNQPWARVFLPKAD